MIRKKKKVFYKLFLKTDNKSLCENKSKFSRQTFIVAAVYFVFLLIILKLLFLQFNYKNINERGNNIFHKQSTEKQERGTIFDRNGNVLAMSIKKYTLYADAKMLKDIKKTKEILKSFNIFFNPSHEKMIKKRKSYIPIKSNIDAKTLAEIKKKLTEKDIQGIGFEVYYIRLYPEQSLAAHILGKTDSKENGIYGIEKVCNAQLTGENIKRQQYTIGGRKIFSDYSSEKDFDHSNDITLTIDRKLQFILEDEMEKGFQQTNAKHAAAIIQNPNNGEILAMVSLPAYNPNFPVKDLEVLKNVAISDLNEPGSTFKIIAFAAVLQEKLFKLTDKVNCENGKMRIAGRTIRDDHGKHKFLTVKEILENSSNVGTAKLALKLGEKNFYEYIRKFGFDSLTGIELTGEAKGILKPINLWTKGSLPTISFGQELSVTAIQTISAYSVIANGGTLLKPKIIKAVGPRKYNFGETVRQDVISADTAQKVRTALLGVVENGTGKAAKVKGYSVGGKTGTAQKYDRALKQYSKKHYMASFCGMIPAMKPELVILVIFDEPEGKNYYASSIAAPVFSKIAERAAKYLNISPDEEVSSEDKNKAVVKKENKKTNKNAVKKTSKKNKNRNIAKEKKNAAKKTAGKRKNKKTLRQK